MATVTVSIDFGVSENKSVDVINMTYPVAPFVD